MDIIKSDIVPLHGAALSMIGGRPENQDDMAYLDTPLGFLVIVCDGMGGGPGGKIASYIVKHEIAKTICECSPQTPRDQALKIAAARAHQALEEKMAESPALIGMGSTFVAILLNSHSAIIAHAGDSRCYRLHGKKCLFRTQDHSLVAELVKKKVMTEEDARLSPQANVITRGLGSTNNHTPEIDETPYKKGDRFVLCTDGVWGSLQQQVLLKVIAQPKDLQQLLSDLSSEVDKIGLSMGGGHDNHTIAIFDLENDSLLKDSISWKNKAMIFFAAVLFVVFVCWFMWVVFNSAEKNRHINTQTIESVPSNVPWTSSDVNSNNTENLEADNINNNSNNQRWDVLYNRLMLKVKIRQESDSLVKQNPSQQDKLNSHNAKETTLIIISKYESAKDVEKKTYKEAKKSIEEKKAEIKKLFEDLSEQTKSSKKHQTVIKISKDVDNTAYWQINNKRNRKSKMYTPTVGAKKLMDKQIVQLKMLRDSLEQEIINY